MKYSILVASLLVSCTFAIELSGRCIENESCKATNSECLRSTESTCIYGTCSCKSGYIAEVDECWKATDFNETCNPSDKSKCDTSKHLECDNNKCNCITGFTVESKVCKPVPKNYTDECVHTLQCLESEQNVVCTGGPPKKCACASGFYRNGDKCDPKLEYDADCSASNANNCNDLKGLSCQTNKCKCLSTLFDKNGVCEQGLKGDDCGTTPSLRECRADKNLECKTGKCECLADLEEKQFNLAGVQVTQCVHQNATLDVPRYEKCVETTTTDAGRFCAANLICQSCYPDSTVKVCLDKNAPTTVIPTQQTTKGSATTVTTTFSSVAISLISFTFLALRV